MKTRLLTTTTSSQSTKVLISLSVTPGETSLQSSINADHIFYQTCLSRHLHGHLMVSSVNLTLYHCLFVSQRRQDRAHLILLIQINKWHQPVTQTQNLDVISNTWFSSYLSQPIIARIYIWLTALWNISQTNNHVSSLGLRLEPQTFTIEDWKWLPASTPDSPAYEHDNL